MLFALAGWVLAHFLKSRISWLLFPRWVGVSFLLLFFGLGLLSSALYLNHFSKQSLANGNHQYFLVEVESKPQDKERSIGLQAQVLGYLDKSPEGNFKKAEAKLMVYLQKSVEARSLKFGDRIWLNTRLNELEPPGNPYEFDYKNYLNLKGIAWQAYADSSRWWISTSQIGFSLIRFSHQWQDFFLEKINQWRLRERETAVSKALLLGFREDIDQELMKAYSSAGAMHVLAVSGLHVGIIYLMLAKALFFLQGKAWRRGLKLLLLIVFLWGYALLTGLSASVVRAATMFSFVAVGQLFNRHTSIYNTIVVSAFFLLLIKPTYLFEVGFQLSYAAVFGIVWLQPRMERLLPALPTRLLRGLWAITTVSIAAQLATFPLGLYYFHQFPALFLISNILVIPLVSILMYYGIGLLVFTALGAISMHWQSRSELAPFDQLWQNKPGLFSDLEPLAWHDGLSELLVAGFDLLLRLLNASVNFVEQQGYLISGITISQLELGLLYVMIVLGCHWLISGKRWRIQGALWVLLFLVAWQFVENYKWNNTQRITLYQTNAGLAWGIYGEGKGILLAPRKLLQDEDALTFHVKHHWWAQNLKAVERVEWLNADLNPAHANQEPQLLFSQGEILTTFPSVVTSDFWLVHRGKPDEKLPPPAKAIIIATTETDVLELWRAYAQEKEVALIEILKLPQQTYTRWSSEFAAKPALTYASQLAFE